MISREFATVEIEVSPALAQRGFPFPRPGARTITQRDFAFVIDRMRTRNAAEFGPPRRICAEPAIPCCPD